MNFEVEINELENYTCEESYTIKKGSIPILFTAPHTIKQAKDDGSIKLNEPYTKAIALYLNKHFDVSAMVKLKDTGTDPNIDNHDLFKTELIRYIKKNNIKLVIDLHGSDVSRDFDVELGTLNNLSATYSTINELKEAFTENGIKNVVLNDPFKGGAITKYLYGIDVEVIQLEINGAFRDYRDLAKLETLCTSLANFIKQYNEYTNR